MHDIHGTQGDFAKKAMVYGTQQPSSTFFLIWQAVVLLVLLWMASSIEGFTTIMEASDGMRVCIAQWCLVPFLSYHIIQSYSGGLKDLLCQQISIKIGVRFEGYPRGAATGSTDMIYWDSRPHECCCEYNDTFLSLREIMHRSFYKWLKCESSAWIQTCVHRAYYVHM